WNELFGLDGETESIYALAAFGTHRWNFVQEVKRRQEHKRTHSARLQESPLPRPSALFSSVHRLAFGVDDSGHTPPQRTRQMPRFAQSPNLAKLPVPDRVSVLSRRALLCRSSAGVAFTGAPLQPGILSAILGNTWESLEQFRAVDADVDLPDVRLLCAIVDVPGIRRGGD